jgi:hypothetical protein
MYIGIILAIISFFIFYFVIKKEIICKCDDNTCDCYTKKQKMAIKYGFLTSTFTFMTWIICYYRNDILKILFPSKPILQIST